MKLTKEIIKEMVLEVLNEQESVLLETPEKEGELITESDEIIVEAPNSVIEAMKKASEHPGKKIKFVRSGDK
jgi:hypothetical protein